MKIGMRFLIVAVFAGALNSCSDMLTDLRDLQSPAAPLYGWAKNFGGPGDDSGQAATIDANGNIFLTGSFQGPADFDPGPGTDMKLNNGLFATKFNADAAYGWTKTISEGGNSGRNVATDASGNIHYPGSFGGTIDFDPDIGQDIRTCSGNRAGFVGKINADGTYGGTNIFNGGGNAYCACSGVAIDGGGNIFLTGTFGAQGSVGTIDFNPYSGTDNKSTQVAFAFDIFLTKLNANETYGWTKTFGGPAANSNSGADAAVDAAGNVYLTGSFEGTVDFNPDSGTDNKASTGSRDAFLTRINANGTYAWTKTFGGTSYDSGTGVATDAAGNIYVTGTFPGTADFDPGPGTDNRSSAGGYDIFLTRINADGSYAWTMIFGGAGDDYSQKVACDADGNVHLAGGFRETVDFDPGPGIDDKISASYNGFLTRINADGTYGWTKTFVGTNNYVRAAAFDADHNIYVTGTFSGTVDFDPGPGTDNKTSLGGSDAFLVRLNRQ
ncbi:MAG: SBBP repeat-containing protein [Spirochaetales bacterium]|nr:SBBP repeat-containing protein [Spirochaetales bacterium]